MERSIELELEVGDQPPKDTGLAQGAIAFQHGQGLPNTEFQPQRLGEPWPPGMESRGR